MSHGAHLGAALAFVLALAGCKSDRPSSQDTGPSKASADAPKATPASVTVTATDFAFDAPADVPAGVVTFQLENHGKELHQAQVVRLEESWPSAVLDKVAGRAQRSGTQKTVECHISARARPVCLHLLYSQHGWKAALREGDDPALPGDSRVHDRWH
jgi:uncharacterized lipoprotein